MKKPLINWLLRKSLYLGLAVKRAGNKMDLEKGYQSLTVRQAHSLDLISLNNILRSSKAYWGYDASFMNAFMEKFAVTDSYLKDNTVYVMVKDDGLVGFFSFVFHDDHSLEMDHFFISPEYIRQGYGKRLWKICTKVANDLKAEEFILWADPEAEAFYLKMGCKKIGVKKSPLMPNRYPPLMQFTLKT